MHNSNLPVRINSNMVIQHLHLNYYNRISCIEPPSMNVLHEANVTTFLLKPSVRQNLCSRKKHLFPSSGWITEAPAVRSFSPKNITCTYRNSPIQTITTKFLSDTKRNVFNWSLHGTKLCFPKRPGPSATPVLARVSFLKTRGWQWVWTGVLGNVLLPC